MRVDGWEEILSAGVDGMRDRTFVWGETDCCRSVAELVDAIHGTDYLAQLAARYADEASARAWLESAGGLKRAVDSVLGAALVGWWHARRGDVVLVDAPGTGEVLGICLGRDAAVIGDGVTLYALERATHVWQVAE
jgi:hypothetical protein